MQLSFYCEAKSMMIPGYVFLRLRCLAEFMLRLAVYLHMYFIRVFLNQISFWFQNML